MRNVKLTTKWGKEINLNYLSTENTEGGSTSLTSLDGIVSNPVVEIGYWSRLCHLSFGR
jgi:hypothetical protein